MSDSETELSNVDHVPWYYIFLSASIWFAFYHYTRYMFPSKSPEWCVRFVTFFHGIVSSSAGVNMCFKNRDNLFENWDNKSTEFHLNLLLMSLGYFLFDVLWCLIYNTETAVMLLHHGVTCIATYRMLSKKVYGIQAVCGLGGAEVTNPFLQLRWMLRSEGYHNSKPYYVTEVIFAVAYVSVRLIFGTYYFSAVVYFYPYDIEFRVYTSILYFVSLVFFWDMISYARKKYFSIGASVIDIPKVVH